eukprot:PhF_6_TR1472/c0_g1_i1/m.2651
MASNFVVPSYLKNLRQLTIHDEEFARMQYLLQVSLRSVTAKILSIHSVHSPQQDALFESQNTGTVVLDSWVNSADLPEDNTVWNIVHHGGRFRITDPNKGAVFGTGLIPFNAARVREAGPQRYEFLHCRIAVGRSFILERQNLGKHGIPAGYDSIKILNPKTPGQDVMPDVEKYYHNYVLNDETKIYPDFVVNFVFDLGIDRVLNPATPPKCESCEARPATVYCLQDDAKLCEPCDREIHNRKISERHQRMPVREIVNTLGQTMCRDHKGVPVQFFDTVSHVPVCIHCRMTGSHSAGENYNHELVPIHEAYRSTMTDVEREARIIEERRKLVLQQLDSIEQRTAGVKKNHEQVQEQVYDIVQRVIQLLHEETQCKLAALSSDEEELRRQLEWFEWMDAFGAYCSRNFNPIDFLQMYKCHSQVLAMAPSEVVDGAATVKPDMRIVGKLELVIDDDGRPPMVDPPARTIPSTPLSVSGPPAPPPALPRSMGGGGPIPALPGPVPRQGAMSMSTRWT